jgi:ketosteroid isomerase-like protein
MRCSRAGADKPKEASVLKKPWWAPATAAAAVAIVAAAAGAVGQQAQTSGRERDAAAIRAHIESIFQAFIDKDSAKLAASHGRDWRGYLTGSRTVIKGRDGYMQSAVGSGPMGPKGQGMVGYKILEYDTVFYGDVAVVNFVAETNHMNGTQPRTARLTLMDIYAKEDGAWIQVASQTSNHPEYQEEMRSALTTLTDAQKQPILAAREAVWRAWYSGDTKRLAELLPPELITLHPGSENFGSYESIVKGSEQFAKSGGKLVKLAFPRTDFQAYGNTVIIYTTYELELENGGKKTTERGKATEVFLRRGGKWLNTGWQLAPEG